MAASWEGAWAHKSPCHTTCPLEPVVESGLLLPCQGCRLQGGSPVCRCTVSSVVSDSLQPCGL